MSIALKTSTARRACSACGCRKTHLVEEVEPMPIALKTSSTAIMQRMCVSQDTPDLRGRADDNRAQDLKRCEHAAHVFHKTHLI